MFYVYVLRSLQDHQLYFGYTNNLRRRFSEHNAEMSRADRGRAPFELIYYEAYRARSDAMRREKMLKLRGNAFGHLKNRIRNSLIET